MDLKGNDILMESRLKFGCTNNTSKYEGLHKVVDMNVKQLKAYDDSKIVVK